MGQRHDRCDPDQAVVQSNQRECQRKYCAIELEREPSIPDLVGDCCHEGCEEHAGDHGDRQDKANFLRADAETLQPHAKKRQIDAEREEEGSKKERHAGGISGWGNCVHCELVNHIGKRALRIGM